jgi:hypothetical protein
MMIAMLRLTPKTPPRTRRNRKRDNKSSDAKLLRLQARKVEILEDTMAQMV